MHMLSVTHKRIMLSVVMVNVVMLSVVAPIEKGLSCLICLELPLFKLAL
jgi:hypothetical protein